MAKDTYYFSHDYNARTDKKIKNLLRKHSMLGYGIYWAIVEDLYNNGNTYPTDYDMIAFDLHASSDVVKSVINDFELFIVNEVFFSSNSVKSRLEERDAKSQRARKNALSKWGKGEDIDVPSSSIRSQRMAEAKKKGTHTKTQWDEMREFFGECVRCGANEDIVKDHITPIYQGGSDGIDNIQPLCRTCNTSKGSENIDHRISWCEQNACEMPAFADISLSETTAIKERKGNKRKVFIAPSATDVSAYFKEHGYSEYAAQKAFNHYALADWKDTQGKQVQNWKQKMSTNWFKPEHKVIASSPKQVII